MSEHLKQLSEDFIKKSKLLGATAAEAMVVHNKSISIQVKNQKLEKIENSDSLDVGLRVFVNCQSACVSTSSKDEKATNEMIERAVAMAKQASPDKLSLPASPDEVIQEWNQENFDLYDDSAEKQDLKNFKNLAFEVENAALSIDNISQCEGAGFHSNLSNFQLSSSNGFSGGYKKSSFQLFCSAIAGTDAYMERDYAVESRTYLGDLPSATFIGQLAGKRAADRLGPRRPPTGSYPVIFDQRVSSSLIGHLTSAINGESISRGSSWLREDLNKQILPVNLTLSENPTRPRIAGSRPFDGEGLPTIQKNFIHKGILKQFILDLRSARKLKLKPLGNAYRSLSSAPQPGVGNLELSSGRYTLKELIKNIKYGLLVTSLIGSTINQNTGDYSRGANGFWIENGEVTFPVNECTIAGNLKEMLISIIAANDGKEYLSKVIPSLLVENMTIAGGQ